MAASSDAQFSSASKSFQGGVKCLEIDGHSVLVDEADEAIVGGHAWRITTIKGRHRYARALIDGQKVCIDRATYEAMATIATRAMAHPDNACRITLDE